MEMTQYDQSATRSVACHTREWCHVEGSVLVSTIGKFVTMQEPQPGHPWWMALQIVEFMYILHPCHQGYFFLGPLDDDKCGLGNRFFLPLSTQWVICVVDYWSSSLVRSHLVSVYKEHKYLHILCPHGEVHLYTSVFFSLIFQSHFFQVTDRLTKPLASAHESYRITHLDIFPSK